MGGNLSDTVPRRASHFRDSFDSGGRGLCDRAEASRALKITMTACYAHSLADDKMAAVSKVDFAGVCPSLDPNRTPAIISAVPKKGLSDLAG